MPQTPTFAGDLTISIRVKDRKASAAWYQRMLGWTLLYDVAEIGWCEMQTHMAGVNVGFSEVESAKAEGGVVPVWGVADIDAARTGLEAKGVRFDGKTREVPGLVKLATFFDPDGHALMLSQNLAKH